ncbi:hypothetical protein BC939DRAFT_182836 [Gamsiella multidivaricata]|uniref:uncharacterized protein n=1 Tax=Gamsiella multidivaricata TaxID=101098 RepID=UPI00221E6919|nr:uncharacterized protein BC939DRAFT_182836 [Gamsiella multidivaricata]KAI7822374.1 hypothetical protein BC939DRAFT_182836 [Gamsiella multidivaricata]
MATTVTISVWANKSLRYVLYSFHDVLKSTAAPSNAPFWNRLLRTLSPLDYCSVVLFVSILNFALSIAPAPASVPLSLLLPMLFFFFFFFLRLSFSGV